MLKQLQKIHKKRFSRRASSMTEYMILVFLILAALFLFSYYIVSGMAGRWKSVGDTLGHGRRYRADSTTCAFDFEHGTGSWYNIQCFELRGCDCYTARQTTVTCRDCIVGCVLSFPMCNATP